MILPEKNFGRQLSRLMVMSIDGEEDPVPLNEDGLLPNSNLQNILSFLMIF